MPLPTTSNVSRPQALGYQARLDDLYLRLVGNFELQINPRIESIRPEATRIDTGQTPEDFVSEFGQTFSRSRFAGGEGLGFAHREESEPDRFWDSTNIATGLPEPGERHMARLLREAENLIDPNFSGLRTPPMVTDGESLWVMMSFAADIRRSDNPLTASPTFTDDTPNDQRQNALTVVGGEVYCSTESGTGSDSVGIYKRGTGGTWTQWSDLVADHVWGIKRRVLANTGDSSGDELYEARSGADSVLVATLPPGESWNDATDAGSHILVAASDGYVYAFTVAEDADPVLEAQTPIPFETPQAIVAAGGLVFIGTVQETGSSFDDRVAKLWRGALDANGNIGDLQLIRQWGGETNPSARLSSLGTDGSSVYVGLTTVLDSGNYEAGLWRYDLTTTGVVKHLRGATSSSMRRVTGITVVGNRVFFYNESDGVFRESVATYQSTGYLMTPAADFFTALDKSWLKVTVEAETPSDSAVVVSYATDLDAMDDPDSSLWTVAGTIDSGSSDEFDIAGTQSRFLVMKVELQASSDSADTPRLHSVSVTANVVGEEVSLTLPVNVSDQVELPGRRRHNVRGLGEKVYQELVAKTGQSVNAALFRPAEELNGTVWSVSTPVPAVAGNGVRTLVCNVEVRGRRVG